MTKSGQKGQVRGGTALGGVMFSARVHAASGPRMAPLGSRYAAEGPVVIPGLPREMFQVSRAKPARNSRRSEYAQDGISSSAPSAVSSIARKLSWLAEQTAQNHFSQASDPAATTASGSLMAMGGTSGAVASGGTTGAGAETSGAPVGAGAGCCGDHCAASPVMRGPECRGCRRGGNAFGGTGGRRGWWPGRQEALRDGRCRCPARRWAASRIPGQ